MEIAEAIRSFRVPPGTRISLRKDHDPGYTGDFVEKEHAQGLLQKGIEQLAIYQDMLYAQDTYALLLIFQAMDAAGKDGTIKHVMSGVNPQGCDVSSFKAPSSEELNHDYLWRCSKRLPERGRIGIFNRSYYEEVLVARVHPKSSKHNDCRRRCAARTSGNAGSMTSTVLSGTSPATASWC